jgi:hypothetical protein
VLAVAVARHNLEHFPFESGVADVRGHGPPGLGGARPSDLPYSEEPRYEWPRLPEERLRGTRDVCGRPPPNATRLAVRRLPSEQGNGLATARQERQATLGATLVEHYNEGGTKGRPVCLRGYGATRRIPLVQLD